MKAAKKKHETSYIIGLVNEIKGRADIARIASREGLSYSTLEHWFLKITTYGVENFRVEKKKKPTFDDLLTRLESLEAWRRDLDGTHTNTVGVI